MVNVAALVAWAGGIGGSVAALAVTERRLRTLVNTVVGDASRPSALQRLAAVEATVADNAVGITALRTELGAVHAQLHPNSGHSLRDAVDQLGRQLVDVGAEGHQTHAMLVRHIASHP